MASLVAALVFCPLISALAFNAPEATPVAAGLKLHPQGVTPRPTPAPKFEIRNYKRQNVQLSLIEGPDNVCGYQYGVSSGALRICGSSKCGFATAMGEIGEVMCYGLTASHTRWTWSSCIPGGTLGSSCLADSACSDNPGILICTDATESYCNVGTFIGLGVEAVWCDSTYYTNEIPISTTYVGQVGRQVTPVSGAVPTASTSTPPTTPISSASSLSLSKSSASASSSSSPVPTPHSTPIGAIVGGVIGGLALIAAIAAGIFICLRMKRKDEQRTQQAPSAPVEVSTQPTGPGSPGAQYPSEKYPATAGATFMPASTAYAPTQAKPEQQYQYQQNPPQQYQQPPVQPPYPQTPAQTWQPPQQQYPQQTGSYVDQQGAPQHPIQPYPPQDYKGTQSPPPSGRPQALSPEALSNRESISGTSSPGSPAPPYPSAGFPAVPEMGANQMSHHAYPLSDQPSEMPT